MKIRSRYFVIASLLVLTVGLGTGLLAYYVGRPLALPGTVYDELRLMPRDAAVVAFANVHDVMTSEFRQRAREALPEPQDGQRQFEEQTGINIETDIDRVVACFEPQKEGEAAAGQHPPTNSLVLARGRFNEGKIEALMREHGAQVETYKDKRIIVGGKGPSNALALTFVEPGLVALGSVRLVRNAVDLRQGGDNAADNKELLSLIDSLGSADAWAVGRFDALRASAHLPPGVAERMPDITWFSASGRVDSALRAVLRAEAGNEEAANNLRDVLRGFMALGKLQAGSNPEIQAMMQSVELGGTGKTVMLTFEVPGGLFEAINGMRPKPGTRAH
jgi:hypothetical protein